MKYKLFDVDYASLVSKEIYKLFARNTFIMLNYNKCCTTYNHTNKQTNKQTNRQTK